MPKPYTIEHISTFAQTDRSRETQRQSHDTKDQQQFFLEDAVLSIAPYYSKMIVFPDRITKHKNVDIVVRQHGWKHVELATHFRFCLKTDELNQEYYDIYSSKWFDLQQYVEHPLRKHHPPRCLILSTKQEFERSGHYILQHALFQYNNPITIQNCIKLMYMQSENSVHNLKTCSHIHNISQYIILYQNLQNSIQERAKHKVKSRKQYKLIDQKLNEILQSIDYMLNAYGHCLFLSVYTEIKHLFSRQNHSSHFKLMSAYFGVIQQHLLNSLSKNREQYLQDNRKCALAKLTKQLMNGSILDYADKHSQDCQVLLKPKKYRTRSTTTKHLLYHHWSQVYGKIVPDRALHVKVPFSKNNLLNQLDSTLTDLKLHQNTYFESPN